MINNSIFNKVIELDNSFNQIKDNFKKTHVIRDLDADALTNLCTEALKVSIKINDELKEALKDPELNSKIIKKYQKAAETCGKLQKKSNKLLSVAHKIIVPHASKEETSITPTTPRMQSFIAKDKALAPGFKEIIGEKLTPAFLQKKLNKAYGYLFSGYAENEKYKYKQEKFIKLQANEKRIKDEIKIQNSKDNEIKEKLKSKPDDLDLLDQRTPILNKIKELENELSVNDEEILATVLSIEKHKENVAKGEKTRNLLSTIGGERVSLKTIDNVKIDGTFVSAEKFNKELKLHGGQIMTLKRTDKDGEVGQFNAISFKLDDYKKNDNHILKTLEKLNILSTIDKNGHLEPGGGLMIVHDAPHILLVRDEDFLKFMYNTKSEEKRLFAVYDSRKVSIEDETEDSETERAFKPINTKSEGGSVILSTGNAGVYEMHKDETLAFLIRGMNVMLFNFRGYGLSEGVPSKTGFHRDIQAAYEWVKKRTGHNDSQILFKALCLSGGAAAFMSAQHPETHIFLDQTYSSMKDLVKEQVTEQIETYVQDQIKNLPEEEQKALKFRLMKWTITNAESLIKSVAGNIVPQFEVAENLAKNHGKKALFYVSEDELTTKAHVERNFEKLAKSGKIEEVSVFLAPGEHAESWVSILSTPSEMSGLDVKVEKMEAESSEALKELEEREKELSDLVKTETERLEHEANQIYLLVNMLEKMSPAERKIRAKFVLKEIDTLKTDSEEKISNLLQQAQQLRTNNPGDIFASDKAEELEKSADVLVEETKLQIEQMQTLAEELASDSADPFAKKKLRMKELHNEIVRLMEYGDSNAQRIRDEIDTVKKMGEKKVKMLKDQQPKAFEPYFMAREQMNRFLSSAKLADNLLK